jgi:Rieske 2Fe-2S family protein
MISQPSYPRAPIDQAGLAQALLPFGQSRMLPPGAYTDPAVFDWEQRCFFGGGWLCVAHSSQVARPGDQRAENIGQGGVLLVRDEDGVLRAFANFCRHRGHELLPCGSTEQRNSIICPYHSWTYSLSGGLRFASGFKGRAGFDQSSWGLAELPVAEWHGLVFVDGSGTAGSLNDSLRSLDELIAPYEPERLAIAGRHDYDSTANWKILQRTTTSATTARDPPGAVRGQPAEERGELRRRGQLDRRLDGAARGHDHDVHGRHQPGRAAARP